MRVYRTFAAALKDAPACLELDAAGLEVEALSHNEHPLYLLRDTVATELNLIAEGESDYGPQQKRWIRNYYKRLNESLKKYEGNNG